jgi:integrase
VFNPAYLQRSKSGIFYLRWPIPRRLHPANKPSTLRMSLKTRDPKAALRLSRSASQSAERLIEVGAKRGMRYDDIRALLRKHFQGFFDQSVEQIAASGRLSGEDKSALVAGPALLEFAITPEKIAEFIAKYDLDIEPGSERYGWLEKELKASYSSYCKAVLEHDASLETYAFGFDAPSVVGKRIATEPVATLTVAALGVDYETEKKLARQWVAKTELEKADHIKLLKEILGAETDIGSLGPTDAKRVKDALIVYPKNRSKNAATRGKSLDEVLGFEGVETLHPTTINKYLQTYSDMFEWANRNGFVDKNVFSGLTIRKNRRDREGQREGFTAAQIASIIDAVTRTEKGLIRKAYQKWGSLIGIYSGARLNEISQLHLKDIRQHEGIWCFDLNDDDDGKHLKAVASKRLVPVHPRLIDLGLLQFVQEIKAKGGERLFPDFRYCPKNGWGRHLGRWFNETLLPKLDLKRKELVFHSLRHTVVTQLMQAGVEEPMVKAIVGHAQEGVTQQNYFKRGYKLQQLAAALEKLDYESADTKKC